MKIKVSEATNVQLDWMVATALGRITTVITGQDRYDRLDEDERCDTEFSEVVRNSKPRIYCDNPVPGTPCPRSCTDWSQGGPIIEREGIELKRSLVKPFVWAAFAYNSPLSHMCGPTPLVAAMRCFVASKLGDEVEVPEELR